MRSGNPVRLCEAVLVLALLQGPAHALTHYVSPSGIHLPPFTNWVDAATNIQAAVDAADGGDTVLVDDGVYVLRTEVLISTNITVESRRGPTATIVDGGGTTRCFRLAASSDCVLSGFTITNGVANTWGGGGGGVYASNAVISNCAFRGNVTEGIGGGLYSVDGVIHDCIFEGNRASIGGGLFLLLGGGGARVDGCVLTGNAADIGGGAFCGPSSNELDAVTNLVQQAIMFLQSLGDLDAIASNVTNMLLDLGGGREPLPPPDMSASPGCPEMMRVSYEPGLALNVMRDCRVTNNTAICGGGLFMLDSPDLVVSNCLLAGNTSEHGAGACCQNGGIIAECIVRENEAAGVGGGLFLYDSGVVLNCHLSSNRANIAGGCIVGLPNQAVIAPVTATCGMADYLGDALQVLGSAFFGNEAELFGGGLLLNDGIASSNIFFGNSASWGGGAANWGGDLSDSIFVENSATIGAGILDFQGDVTQCVMHYNSAKAIGGGIAVFPVSWGDAEVERCRLLHNYAAAGGGIALVDSATARSCTITSNTAGIAGGGIFCMLGAETQTSLVRGNRAADGAGVYCLSGGHVVNSTVTENDALYEGGGLYVVTNELGGGWYYDTDMVVANSIIYGNTASNAVNFLNVASNVTYSYVCALPAVPGAGNISNDPQLTAHYRLGSASPCIDAGNNGLMASSSDLDGMSRPLDGDNDGTSVVDMGCYEHLNSAADSDGDTMPDGWEVEHAMNLLADDGDQDVDFDSMDNRSEYVADTDPRDPNSVLAVVNVATKQGGTRIDWKGGRHAWQFLECRSELASSTGRWNAILALPPPTPMTNAIIDLGATNKTLFYRIRAER